MENAIVVPWGRGKKRAMARPAGVFTADGAFCADAMTYRAATRPTTVEPECPKPEEITQTLPGTLLFGGLAYGHFGHALCESTGRLWAADVFGEPIDHILYFPKKPLRHPNRSLPLVNAILGSLGPLPPALAINDPTRVERLVIAPQGFGVDGMAAGAPEFRAFIHRRWRDRVTADGPDKIYISRSKVFKKRGRLLLEERIEAELEREGFTIFHPQQHSLDSQLAHYKAAKVIVSTDNSALHLAACVVQPDCKVAILVRRPGRIFRDFERQFDSFAGITAVISNTCDRFWFRAGEAVRFNETFALIDFEDTGRALAEAGIVSNTPWVEPTEAEIQEAVAQLEARGELPLEEVEV
ncbi:MAG: glycosyltransferase 61 family protein [Pseudomonadota bacterium]